MTDLVKHNGSALTDQIEWTRLVTDGDRAGSLLPDTYKGKPANVLIAIGLGASMGLSPAESLYRIAVIKGKPTAGAELIAANVRKAGHKLRVATAPGSVTATIIRSDDPDFPFEVTRDLAWAQRMGLAQNDNYKKQPETMLQWRAISAVARLACPEALYGVQYTPDEVEGTVDTSSARRSASDAFTPAPADTPPAMNDDNTEDAEVVEDAAEGEPISPRTRGAMFALLSELGIDDADEQKAGMSAIVGRTVESRATLTEDEGQKVVDHLRGVKRQREIAAVQAGA